MYSVVGETIMLSQVYKLDHDHYACCDAVAIAVVGKHMPFSIDLTSEEKYYDYARFV